MPMNHFILIGMSLLLALALGCIEDNALAQETANWLRTIKNNGVCREVPVSRCLLAEEYECGNLTEECALECTFTHATP